MMSSDLQVKCLLLLVIMLYIHPEDKTVLPWSHSVHLKDI